MPASGFLCCLADPVDFDAEVNLFQFELHRAVGKGAFGKVRVVEHKQTKKLYALKYIDKARCVKQKAVANILQERRLLEEVDHPFVVNLRYAFQDDANCFFVLDLMLGGDLRFHLERRQGLGEDAVRFWVAELSSALSYLHKQLIIHRDIKPDNILLDIMGHAHITDFNVAIHYSTSRLHTSVAGSLAYMAPEVCTRKGYSWQADWWSLGVCAYELLFGKRPFDGRTADQLTTSIAKDPIHFPERAPQVCSKEGIQAVSELLDRDRKKRLGCRTDEDRMASIRAHPWFKAINWELLEDKDAQPPFVPDMRKANFDISHELDEFLMVEKPLTATKRKQNVDPSKLKPEFRQLEEEFTTFDFTRPKRMSYYPHNQPLTITRDSPSFDQGDDALAIPRLSSVSQSQSHAHSQVHTSSFTMGSTSNGGGAGAGTGAGYGGGSVGGEKSRTGSPTSVRDPTSNPNLLPTPPERARLRTPVSGHRETTMPVGIAITSDNEPLHA